MSRALANTPAGAPDAKDARPGEAPLYQLVARTLQTEIVRGVYHVGALLPSEADLMRRFAVSRHTVRAAIRMLHDARLVRTQHGLGSIILEPALGQSFVHEINTISDLFPVDAATHYDPVDRALVKLPRCAQFFPSLDASRDWLRVTGERRKAGETAPFNEIEIFIAARFAGVSRLIGAGTGSLYTALEAIYGETVVEVEQVIGGFVADGARGARIGLASGDAGIEVRRLHRVSSDNDVAILSLNRFATVDYSFSMILKRTPKSPTP